MRGRQTRIPPLDKADARQLEVRGAALRSCLREGPLSLTLKWSLPSQVLGVIGEEGARRCGRDAPWHEARGRLIAY